MLVWTVCSSAAAQEQDSLYRLTAFAGYGYTRNFSSFPQIPGVPHTPLRDGTGGFVRVMWTPEHLLSVGLEAGLSRIYVLKADHIQTPYGITNMYSSLNMVPVSLSFSMHLTRRLEGYIASTSYILFSNTTSFGSSTSGTMMSIGFSAALSYLWPLDDDWSAGCEVRWYHIDKSGDDNANVAVVVSYQFLEW